MKMTTILDVAILTALLIPLAYGQTQSPQKASTFTVAGHTGEAPLILVNGKSYIDLESLARLTQGTLSFKANHTILTLPGTVPEAAVPHAITGFSSAFTQAGIEELSVIREWRSAIVTAVENNTPASLDWLSTQHRLAEKNLALASASASTDDDHSAFTLLSSEFNNMQNLSDRYLTIRRQGTFISPDTFNSTPLEDQILNCARGFVAMTGSHEFQDQSACH